MEPIIIGGIALIVGLVLGKLIFAKNAGKIVEDAKSEAARILADGQSQAETLKKRSF